MYKGKTIAVVVPAHNEQSQIARVIETMPPMVDRIVVVDDASGDDTKAVTLKCQAADPRVELIVHPRNQGVGGAIATGYKWVRDNELDVAVVMAGDAQMDPVELPGLLDPVVEGQVDYTKGNRLYSGEAFQKIPKSRFFGNAVLSMLTKIASGYWHVTDSQCGYTAINLKAL
jgi:glycosyltransferase involved in cell wall biosynthesis